MDGLSEFIRGMTIWNWLALIAFIFFPLSALNAFLGLKARYQDWRGTKNKTEFEKRLRQLEKELLRIENFREQPTTFFLYALDKGTQILGLFLSAFVSFMVAFSLYVSPMGNGLFELLFLAVGLLILFNALTLTLKLSRLATVVNDPMAFAIKIVEFIEEGQRKRFHLNPDSNLIQFVARMKESSLARVELTDSSDGRHIDPL